MQQRLSVYIGERSERVGRLYTIRHVRVYPSFATPTLGYRNQMDLLCLRSCRCYPNVFFLTMQSARVRFRLLLPILNRTVGGDASSSDLSAKRVIVGAFQRLIFYLA